MIVGGNENGIVCFLKEKITLKISKVLSFLTWWSVIKGRNGIDKKKYTADGCKSNAL